MPGIVSCMWRVLSEPLQRECGCGVSFSRAEAPGLCFLIDTFQMEKNIKVPPKAEAGVFCCRVITEACAA